MLSNNEDLIIGNCLDNKINNFLEIKDRIDKETENNRKNYFNYCYIPFSVLKNEYI